MTTNSQFHVSAALLPQELSVPIWYPYTWHDS